MKIRTDFVSNSSSSSFICAVNSTYSIEDLAKDIARKCINKKHAYHDPQLEEENRRTVDWCLNEFQLLFLGALLVGKQDFTYSKKDVEIQANARYKGLSKPEIDSIAEKKWNSLLEQMHAENEVKPGSVVHDAENETIVFTDEVLASGLAVDSGTMHHLRLRATSKNGMFDQKMWPDIIEQHAKWHEDNIDDVPFIETYAITQETIDSTRALLAAKKDLRLDGWEDLDSLQRRLDNGEKLFALLVGRDGDGTSCYSVYQEDGATGIDDLAIEVLHSESL